LMFGTRESILLSKACWATSSAKDLAEQHPGAGYSRPYLLQIRGCQPRRLAQAQHRRCPGLLQQEGGHQAAFH
jgi:hypothetical protein